jgi:ABC-type dipeptide/oligopeptide/nickel transport system ATPase subunit
MNKRITFEPEFTDITLYQILEKVPMHSELNIVQELDLNKFETLIKKYLSNTTELNKTQFTQFTDEPGSLNPFYTFKTVLGDNIAISYDYTELKNQEEDEDLDEELMIDEIIKPIVKIESKAETCNEITIYYNESTSSIVKSIMGEINDCIHNNIETNLFYTIGLTSYGFNLVKQEVNLVDIDVELNYGSSFVPVYDDIINNLKTKFHGLILLHGAPGTGKTTIIRKIISELCNTKKIIYIPAYMIEQIANPEFITFIQKYKESVLVLEDAEFALQSRSEEYGAQAVSNLLNITNGLLNDAVKIQVIATFNMNKKDIDSALLRPGRLLNDWKFNKLTIEESKKLADSLKKKIEISEPMTIAEIYAEKTAVKNVNTDKKRKIGF